MRISFTALLCIFIATANAQQNVADSVRQLIAQSKEDTNRVWLFWRLGSVYRYSHPDSDYYYQYKGKLLAEKIHFQIGVIGCLIGMGNGLIYMGDYSKALETQFETLKLSEQINYLEGTDKSLANIGVIYTYQGDMRKAIEYHYKAKIIDEKINEQVGLETDLINLGDSYEKLNILDSALYYTNLAYEKAISLKDSDGIAIGLNNLGNIHVKLNNDRLALDYYHLAIIYYREQNDIDGICECTLSIAGIYKKQSQSDSAVYYALQSLALGKNSVINQRVLDAGNFLASFYKAKHAADSTLKYLELTVAYKDSLFNQEKTKAIQNLTFEESIRQQEIAELKVKDEENYKKNLQLAGIAIFIPSFFLFVLFLSRRKAKPRTIEFLGILALLMAFEFIILFIHPYISQLTNEAPVFMLLILVAVAAILVPMHHRMEHWVKERLVQRHLAVKPSTGTASEAGD